MVPITPLASEMKQSLGLNAAIKADFTLSATWGACT
jgi:hypothetical protein